MSIALADITKLETSNTLGLVPNGMTVYTASGASEKFVVNKRKVWIEKINALRGL
jgi:hypothetical protein